MKKHNITNLVVRQTTELPFNLYYKRYGFTILQDIKNNVKDLKQILRLLPEDEWVLIKKNIYRNK